MSDHPLSSYLTPYFVAKFKSLGVNTLDDLISYYPRKCIPAPQKVSISQLRIGDFATIKGVITESNTNVTRGKKRFDINVTDSTKTILCSFFISNNNYQKWLANNYVIGKRVIVQGVVRYYKKMQFIHPKIWILNEETENLIDLKSQYPITLYRANSQITSPLISMKIKECLQKCSYDDFPNIIPAYIREAHSLLRRFDAIKSIHEPETLEIYEKANRTLLFEEAFILQCVIAKKIKTIVKNKTKSYQVNIENSTKFEQVLGFELTDDQKKANNYISRKLAKTSQMRILLQGDVGAGKTVVALKAMLQVVYSGGQAVLVVPTQVLAVQHYKNIKSILEKMGSTQDISLLVSGIKNKKDVLGKIKSGESSIIVSTHAIFAEKIVFNELGLVVIDEQHRFGVDQRAKLFESDVTPHMLVMTATPIPRTVAMTIFGELDTITIKQLPKLRKDIKTFVVDENNESWVNRMFKRVREEIDDGKCAFIVCPKIDEKSYEQDEQTTDDLISLDSSHTDKKNIHSTYEISEKLRNMSLFKDVSIEVLHSKIEKEKKDEILEKLQNGQTKIVVSTTVIEVGIDIKNASTIIIFNAERFGISTLHQLRGRIGRSNIEAICFLVDGGAQSETAPMRLKTVASTTDGFELAKADLEIRGEGNILGKKQSGLSSAFKLLRAIKNERIICEAKKQAEDLYLQNSTLEGLDELKKAISDIEATYENFMIRF